MLSSDDYTDSLSSPLATSSPYKRRNNNRSDIRISLCDKGIDVGTTYAQETHAKRQFLKTLVINFCSIRNKVADLAVCIGEYNPDIIIGAETHLDSSVNSSELFPSNYSVIRKDRNFDNSKHVHGHMILCHMVLSVQVVVTFMHVGRFQCYHLVSM